MTKNIYIGTSGWTYKDWQGKFYPEKVKGAERLNFYSRIFNTVEVNATFYRTPFKNMIKSWNQKLNKDFHMVIKGNRSITHRKKIKDCKEQLDRFLDRALQIKTLRIILWQLPPSLKKDIKRLNSFLEQLPKNVCHAMEFRHKSWWNEDVIKTLEKHKAGFVSVSHPELPDTIYTPTDFIYLRFHGIGKKLYRYNYSKKELSNWASKLKPLINNKSLYAFFNNDYNAYAPEDAKDFKEILTQ